MYQKPPPRISIYQIAVLNYFDNSDRKIYVIDDIFSKAASQMLIYLFER